jgi:hypothetical protein
MSDDRYLWDKSGPAHPFVAKLEHLLAGKRARIERTRSGATGRRFGRHGSWYFVGALAAAAAVLAFGVYLAWAGDEPSAANQLTPSALTPSAKVDGSRSLGRDAVSPPEDRGAPPAIHAPAESAGSAVDAVASPTTVDTK